MSKGKVETEITRLVRAETERAVGKLREEVRALKADLKALQKRRPGLTTAPRATRGGGGTSARLTPKSIRTHRERLDLTQRELAALADVTPVCVYLWESGRAKPTGRRAEVLAELRKVSRTEARRRLEAVDFE